MSRSKETFGKKEVRKKQEKKRKDKEAKRLAKKSGESSGLDSMIAYVDEFGNITSTPPEETKKEEVKLEDIEVSVPKGGNTADEDPVKKGIVSFFNDQKGFGFIQELETKQSVFVHINNVEGEIKEGNKVSFEVEMGDRGPAAVNVKLDN